MRFHSTLATLCGLALVLAPSAARAENVVCDHVSPALRAYGAIADTLITKLGPSEEPGEPWGTTIYRSACVRRAKIAATWFDPLLVATASSSVAARFTHGTINGLGCWSRLLGDAVTGGGAVTGIDAECIDGTVDSSGTHPAVAACAQALTDSVAVSDFFASQPATRDLGNVTVPAFTTYTLTAAPNEIVHIGSLDLKGGYDPEFKNLCYDYTVLELAGGPAVVNIDRLEIGPCVDVELQGEAVVLNVTGRGSTIKIGRGAIVPVPILAPARNIVVRGTLDDGGTFLGSTWGRRIKMFGLSSIEHLFPSCD